MSGVRIEPYDPAQADEVLAVINDAFEVPRSPQWFTWKHRDGPWGPSHGVVARDDRGLVGVRLLLPWRFKRGDESVLAYRAVEASTVARAQGQGIFSRLNRELMDACDRAEQPTLLFSTPNQLSRNGYKKLGWLWLEPIRHVSYLAPFRRGRARQDAAVDQAAIATYTPRPLAAEARLRTAWSAEALEWRLDARSGNRYGALAIGSNGIAYRIVEAANQRTILVLARWGRAEADRTVLAEISRRERARIVLDVREGARDRRVALARGESLLTVWSPDTDLAERWQIDDSRQWAVGFADLESVL